MTSGGTTTAGPAADPNISTTAGSRRADIQGLRAVAVLMVVAFHAGLDISGGFTGVDVFFVISGFVITAMLLREMGSEGRLSFAGFYARRVRRILPASALVISFVAIASIGAINPAAQKGTARTGLAGSVFVANILLGRAKTGYFDISPTSNPLLHIWSLSVEEQFYLAFPALLVAAFFLARRRPPGDVRRIVGGVVGAVAVASFAVSWYATYHSTALAGFRLDSQSAFYLAPTRAWEFAVGALLALAVPALARLPRALAAALGLIGAALVVGGAFGISGTTPFPGGAALLPVVGAGLLVVAGTIGANPFSTGLSVRPLTRIGDLSYSWYLWHWPFVVFAAALFPSEGNAALIGAVISIVPAWLSFRLLETPIRNNRRIRGRRAVLVAGVCIVIPAMASFALLHAPKPSASSATRALLQASRLRHADQVRGCNRGIPVGKLPDRCTWRTPDAKGTVVLLGDSNAGQFSEPAAAAANQAGFDLTVATFADCPFVDLAIRNALGPAASQRCRRFVTTSTDDLVAHPPSLVLLAASGPLYLSNATTFRDPQSGAGPTAVPAEKARLWTAGLTRTLARFHDAGIPVVVIHTVPQWRTWDTRSCAEVRVYLSPRSCGADQTRAEVADYSRAAVTAEDRALAQSPGAHGVDFVGDLCRAGSCLTNRGDFWVYKDGRHLSVVGSRRLTDRFRSIIESRVPLITAASVP